MSVISSAPDTAAILALRHSPPPVSGASGGIAPVSHAAALDWLGRLPPGGAPISGEPRTAGASDVDGAAARVLSRLGG